MADGHAGGEGGGVPPVGGGSRISILRPIASEFQSKMGGPESLGGPVSGPPGGPVAVGRGFRARFGGPRRQGRQHPAGQIRERGIAGPHDQHQVPRARLRGAPPPPPRRPRGGPPPGGNAPPTGAPGAARRRGFPTWGRPAAGTLTRPPPPWSRPPPGPSPPLPAPPRAGGAVQNAGAPGQPPAS